MPWITTLDGTDSRAAARQLRARGRRGRTWSCTCGRFPARRSTSATAAPHHGQAFGSLVIIDPQVADDDGMGPVRRLTPEVAFPESQGGREVYGTPGRSARTTTSASMTPR